jgi:hypothetical protein
MPIAACTQWPGTLVQCRRHFDVCAAVEDGCDEQRLSEPPKVSCFTALLFRDRVMTRLYSGACMCDRRCHP